MSNASKHKAIQAIAVMDLIRTDCEQMRRRLDMLESYFDTRSGSFDIQRAFIKEIDQQIGELRASVANNIKDKAA